MFIRVDESGSLSAFKNMLEGLQKQEEVSAVLVLCCDANGLTVEGVNPLLQACDKPVFGGVFPAVLHGARKLDVGTIMVGMTCRVDCLVQEGLDEPGKDYLSPILSWAQGLGKPRTMLAFCDAMAGGADSFSEALLNVFGLNVRTIGGGAGSINFRPKPCVFSSKGMLQDAAVMAVTDMESGVSARHGWHALQGPFTVTEVADCWLKELDGRPAFELYREIVEQESGKRFGMESFFDMARAYPFGVPTLHGEHLVRDPLAMKEDGSMLLAGAVKDGMHLDLLSGNKRSMIHAAERAHWHARNDLRLASGQSVTLCMDCISRVLFLEEDFEKELAALHDGLTELVGACSIGEFAGNGRDYLAFYNKTVVVGVLKAQKWLDARVRGQESRGRA